MRHDLVIADFTKGKFNIMIAVVEKAINQEHVGELILVKLDKRLVVPESLAACDGTYIYSMKASDLTILGDL